MVAIKKKFIMITALEKEKICVFKYMLHITIIKEVEKDKKSEWIIPEKKVQAALAEGTCLKA